MRRKVIGMAIGAAAVRAIGVAGERVRWAVEVEREPGEMLGAALTELLQRVPRQTWVRPVVVVAIGPSAAQVKRLTGLPPLGETDALAAVVRENARRFFLQYGGALVTTGVRVLDAGNVWAAALDPTVVTEVERVCRDARLTVRSIIPTAVGLRYAYSAERFVSRDGGVREVLSYDGQGLYSVRRLPTGVSEVDGDGAPLVHALRALGDRAGDFADAFGATWVPRDEPLAYRPGTTSVATGVPSRARLAGATAALACACASAIVGPPLAAAWAAHTAAARLAPLVRRERATMAAEADLQRITAALSEVGAFDARHRPVTLLLRDISKALPNGSALVAFRLDSSGGNLVALAPHAAAVVSAIEHVPGLASPEIVGPVTRETVGTKDLERLTVRFRLTGTGRSPARSDAAQRP